MDVLSRLDQAREEINVLEHPFYQRWSAGELSAAELELYAGQYHHAVVALAEASDAAAAKAGPAHASGLRAHAEEELAHVELWEDFARATASLTAGSTTSTAASTASAAANATSAPERSGDCLEETQACARAWTAGENLLEHLAVLYAIEASQPEVSRTKLDGLTAHYGYRAEGPAVEYFTLHERLDVEHACQARELIAELMSEADGGEELAEGMVTRAREALQGNWRLLDGVEAAATR